MDIDVEIDIDTDIDMYHTYISEQILVDKNWTSHF